MKAAESTAREPNRQQSQMWITLEIPQQQLATVDLDPEARRPCGVSSVPYILSGDISRSQALQENCNAKILSNWELENCTVHSTILGHHEAMLLAIADSDRRTGQSLMQPGLSIRPEIR